MTQREQLNKEYETYILVGERTVDETSGEFLFGELGNINLRGRKTSSRIYALHDAKTENAPPKELLARHHGQNPNRAARAFGDF